MEGILNKSKSKHQFNKESRTDYKFRYIDEITLKKCIERNMVFNSKLHFNERNHFANEKQRRFQCKFFRIRLNRCKSTPLHRLKEEKD